jgi:glycogen operon protein
LTWLDWSLDERQQQFLRFARRVIEIFHEQPVLHRRRFFHGAAIEGEHASDIAWLGMDGQEMEAKAWSTSFVRCLGVELFGDQVDADEHGEVISGDTLLLLFNADHNVLIPFTLPAVDDGEVWELLLDSADIEATRELFDAGSKYQLQPCSLAVLRIRTTGVEPTI